MNLRNRKKENRKVRYGVDNEITFFGQSNINFELEKVWLWLYEYKHYLN